MPAIVQAGVYNQYSTIVTGHTTPTPLINAQMGSLIKPHLRCCHALFGTQTVPTRSPYFAWWKLRKQYGLLSYQLFLLSSSGRERCAGKRENKPTLYRSSVDWVLPELFSEERAIMSEKCKFVFGVVPVALAPFIFPLFPCYCVNWRPGSIVFAFGDRVLLLCKIGDGKPLL